MNQTELNKWAWKQMAAALLNDIRQSAELVAVNPYWAKLLDLPTIGGTDEHLTKETNDNG